MIILNFPEQPLIFVVRIFFQCYLYIVMWRTPFGDTILNNWQILRKYSNIESNNLSRTIDCHSQIICSNRNSNWRIHGRCCEPKKEEPLLSYMIWYIKGVIWLIEKANILIICMKILISAIYEKRHGTVKIASLDFTESGADPVNDMSLSTSLNRLWLSEWFSHPSNPFSTNNVGRFSPLSNNVLRSHLPIAIDFRRGLFFEYLLILLSFGLDDCLAGNAIINLVFYLMITLH